MKVFFCGDFVNVDCGVKLDIFCDADSISFESYPALMKVCLAFSIDSPLDNAFCNPPAISSSRLDVFSITILIYLHHALGDIVFLFCIQVLLIILPLVLSYLDRRVPG